MAKQALERYAYRAYWQREGQRGLEIFRREKERIRCVVLNLTRPVMSGEETPPHLKLARLPVPVILALNFSESVSGTPGRCCGRRRYSIWGRAKPAGSNIVGNPETTHERHLAMVVRPGTLSCTCHMNRQVCICQKTTEV